MTIGDLASQPVPTMEYADPDSRFPSFMGAGGEAMEQEQDMEGRQSDGEEEALRDVQHMFSENLVIHNV